MYLITAYFDEKTTQILTHHQQALIKVTNNQTMKNVPPHLTIAAFNTRDVSFLDKFQQISFNQGEIEIVSVGTLLPYVIYLTPVLNKYLMTLSQTFQNLLSFENVFINDYYQPYHWLPHITVAKRLTHQEMMSALDYLTKCFVPIKGKITKIGISQVNPYQDLLIIHLKSKD